MAVEINKSKELASDIDIYGGKNKSEAYFNNKMKTFFLNEKKKVNYKLQKMDYMINKA